MIMIIMLMLIIIIIIIIIDEQGSQNPTSLLAFPKFSAVAFLRGDLLILIIIIIIIINVTLVFASRHYT